MSAHPFVAIPHIPTSWGELIDKLTILEIKSERITKELSVANIRKELALLRAIAEPVLTRDEIAMSLAARLKLLNEALWDIEVNIRAKEDVGQFDEEFIELARSVYRRNDERSALKRQINQELESELREEKNYDRSARPES